MKSKFESLELIRNEALQKFELTVDGYTSFIDYSLRGDIMMLLYIESPIQNRGKGVASALLEKTFQYLDDNDFKVVPICPVISAYFRKNKQWMRILHDDAK